MTPAEALRRALEAMKLGVVQMRRTMPPSHDPTFDVRQSNIAELEEAITVVRDMLIEQVTA